MTIWIPLEGLVEIGTATPLSALQSAKRLPTQRIPVVEVQLLPVVPNHTKVLCVGLNYADHIAETGRDTPTYPVLFTKYAASLIGPTDDIALPPETGQLDWEGELAVVIGKTGRRIRVQDAPDHIAGYTVANDITVRDYQYRTHRWLQTKAWDNSKPIGPDLITPDEVDIPTLIATISEFTALHPGDLILTGGVGYRRNPSCFWPMATGSQSKSMASVVSTIESETRPCGRRA